MENIDFYSNKLLELVIEFAPKLLLAIVTLVIGLWIIKRLSKVVEKALIKGDVDLSLRPFLRRLLEFTLKILLLASVISMIGVEITSVIAILGAAGLAIGLALQGSLSNLAGGVIILIFKPFRVGDLIELSGQTGIVKEIRIFYTTIRTPQNHIVTVPNGNAANSTVINFTMEDTRRIDLLFGIGYGDDIDKAKSVLKSIIESETKILKDPPPLIAISELADNSVNIKVHTWVHNPDYWYVFHFMHEAVKKEFDKAQISIPFPQRDIHIIDGAAKF